MPEWMIAKLELTRTREFPNGSPSRSYILRVPLSDDGMIDELVRAREPRRATVRRFWPNEPDQSGYIVRKGAGWAFSYAIGEDDDEELFHLEDHPIRPGGYLTIMEPSGEHLRFKVVQLTGD